MRPSSVVAWMMLVGLAAALAMIAVDSEPLSFTLSDALWMLIAGAGNAFGLLLTYSALRQGKVGLVAPIASTEGAVAAVIAVSTGESIRTASLSLLVTIVAGIVLAALAKEERPVPGERKSLSIELAALAALAFGVSLFATGRLGASLPVGWALLPPRAVGVVAITIPLALTGRLHLVRAAWPLVVAAGLAEVAGFASYVVGARHDISVTAVLASQFAAIASLAAYFLFKERLTRLQLLGVALIVLGVAALTVVQGT
jgi:drug/metabolite transporter (DMT)-like permease